MYPGGLLSVVYHAGVGEPLEQIVLHTADISLEPSEQDPYAADRSVGFPDGTVIRLEDVRTDWFLNDLGKAPPGTESG